MPQDDRGQNLKSIAYRNGKMARKQKLNIAGLNASISLEFSLKFLVYIASLGSTLNIVQLFIKHNYRYTKACRWFNAA